jgi:hypothetical protein
MATKKVFEIEINGVKRAITDVNELTDQQKQLEEAMNKSQYGSKEFKNLQRELNQVNKEMAKNHKNTEELSSALQEAGVEGTAFGKAQGFISEKMQQGGAVIKLLRTGFGSLRVAMLAVPIFALVAAFGALFTWFTKSNEGAKKLDQIMAGLGAVMGILTDKIAAFGKMIFETISNPKQAIKDLGALIEENLINRFKAFGVIWEAIKRGDLSDLADGVIQLGTGIEGATGKALALVENVKDLGKELSAGARKAIELEKRMQALVTAERALSIENAKRKGLVDALSKAADDVNLSEAERIARLEKAAKIELDMTNQAISLAKERLDIIREQNAISNSSEENLQKEADAQKALIELQNQSASMQQDIANKRSAIEKSIRDRIYAAEKDLLLERMQGSLLLEKDAQKRMDTLIAIEEKTAEELKKQENILAEEIALIEEQKQSKIAEIRKVYEDKDRAADERIMRSKLGLDIELAKSVEDRVSAQIALEEYNRDRQLELADLTEKEKQAIIEESENKIKGIRLQAMEEQNAMQASYMEGLKQSIETGVMAIFSIVSTLMNSSITRQQEALQDLRNQIGETEARLEESKNRAEEMDSQLADSRGQRREFLLKQIEKERAATAQLEAQKAKQGKEEEARLAKLEKAKQRQAQVESVLTIATAGSAVASAFKPDPASTAAPFGIGLAIRIAAALGFVASLAGALASFKKNKFATGVIDLQGPGTETSDSIPSLLSRGESVMTARATRMFKPQLVQMNAIAAGNKYANGVVDVGGPGAIAGGISREDFMLLIQETRRINQTPVKVVATEVTDVASRLAQVSERATA